MNRKELHQLVLTEVSAIDTDTGNPDADTRQLVNRLWPVLEQVWAEGYNEGVNDQYGGELDTTNPYSEDENP